MIGLATVALVVAAPSPFPRPCPPRPARLREADLVGTWLVWWGTVRVTWELHADGRYRCPDWPGGGYVGSWGIDRDGLLYFSEVQIGHENNPPVTYAARLNPVTLTGPVEIGAAGVTLRLVRRK